MKPEDIAPWPFPHRLRQARERAGLTQLQVAERAGLKRHRYCDFERGHVRPRREEVTRVAHVLGVHGEFLLRGSDWTPPKAPRVRPASALRKRCQWRPEQRTPAAAYLAAALEQRRSFVTRCLQLIATRSDLPRVRDFLRDVACHSILEVQVLLGLLALGARPVWESPLRVGFRKWPVLLKGRQAGDCRHPGLELVFLGVHILFLFQVTVHVRKGGKPQLDALVVVRVPGGDNRFLVAEVDGPLHVEEQDGQRQACHDLSEARVGWAAFQAPNSSPVRDLCEGILRRMGVDLSDEAVAQRLEVLQKRTRRKTGALRSPRLPAAG